MLREQYPDAFIVAVSAVLCRADAVMNETGCCDSMLMFSDLKRWMHEMGVTTREPRLRGGARRHARAALSRRQDGIVKSMDARAGLEPRVHRRRGRLPRRAGRNASGRREQRRVSGDDRLRGQLRQRPGHSQQSL